MSEENQSRNGAAFKPQSEILFLVVDDDKVVRDTVREYLHSFGYGKVITAPSVHEAMSLLENEPVDFVISDWEMPGLSGLELLRHMRDDDRFRDVPFIMVTAPISHENLKIERAAMSEVDAYILKPFRATTLRQKIEEALTECRERARRGAIIVDDDPEVRSLVTEILQQMKFEPVLTAQDGNEGFDLLNLNSARVGIVICDWEMPRMSGIELLRKIRIDRDLTKMPFLMITSQSSIEHLKLQKAIEADVDHYLLKPFTVKAFKEKVEFVIERAQTEQKVRKLLENADKAAQAGDSALARHLYKQVIQKDKKNIDAYLGLARAKIKRSGNTGFDECIQMIKNAIRINPKLDRSYVALAQAFEEGVSLEKAASTLRLAFRKCPPSEKLHYEMGRVLFRLGKLSAALAELNKALELKPNFEDAKSLMEQIYRRAKV